MAVQNRQIARVGMNELSIYNTMRIAEMMAGVSQDISERANFIRQWVKGQLGKPGVQQFFYQGLSLGTKKFGANLVAMERRLKNIRTYANNSKQWSDKKRLDNALSDLHKSGYLIYETPEAEPKIELSSAQSKKVTTYGMVLVKDNEFDNITSDGAINDNGLVLSFMSYFPATYIAFCDALEIAGFVLDKPTFVKGDVLKVRLESSKLSKLRPLLESLPLPDDDKTATVDQQTE